MPGSLLPLFGGSSWLELLIHPYRGAGLIGRPDKPQELGQARHSATVNGLTQHGRGPSWLRSDPTARFNRHRDQPTRPVNASLGSTAPIRAAIGKGRL